MCKALQKDMMCEGCRKVLGNGQEVDKFEVFQERSEGHEQGTNLNFMQKIANFVRHTISSKEVQNDIKGQTPQEIQLISKNQYQGCNQLTQLTMESSGCMIPDPRFKSSNPSLSDDFMIHSQYFCGISDGVSQWKQFYINPKAFGQQLLTKVHEIHEHQMISYQENFEQVSKKILSDAYSTVNIPGSCSIIYYYIENNSIYFTWIGNSQALVLRRNSDTLQYEVLYQTQTSQHGFNKPFQLINWPDQAFAKKLQIKRQELGIKLKNLIQQSSKERMTSPQDAWLQEIQVQADDLIICASDGFFVNIQVENILQIINQHKELSNVNDLAEELCKSAWNLSQQEDYESPFVIEARKQGLNIKGGKQDDCTVIVSKVISY